MSDHNTTKLEEELIGLILTNADAFYDISGRIQPAHFFDGLLGEIYGVIYALYEGNRSVTLGAIAQGVKEKPKGVSLDAMLLRFSKDTPQGMNAIDNVDYIVDASRRRNLINRTTEIIKLANDTSKPAEEQIEACHGVIDDILDGEPVEEVKSFREASQSVIDDIERLLKDDSVQGAGIKTGIPSVDELLGENYEGELILIAGPTSSGKSIMGGQVADSIASQGVPTLLISNEMNLKACTTRSLTRMTGVKQSLMMNGGVNQEELESLCHASQERQLWPLYIDDQGGDKIEIIRARAKRLIRTKGVRAIVLDHFHELKPVQRRENNEATYSEMAYSIREMARDLGIPIFMMAQLKRPFIQGNVVKNEKDVPRPSNSDLKYTGALEQVAHKILFIHRPAYWMEKHKPQKVSEEWQEGFSYWEHKAQLILSKMRGGKADQSRIMAFNGPRFRFDELAATGEALL
ncbi:MAG: replicative DNA helicase [Cohaesibacter sp.]|jgi:replicative DNA helicase|nr:replicative DNA helicase [Cohaesibacter sp.]